MRLASSSLTFQPSRPADSGILRSASTTLPNRHGTETVGAYPLISKQMSPDMNTAALSSRQFDGLTFGRNKSGETAEAGRFGQPRRPMLDAGDVGAVAFTFAFVAGLVLSAALVCDAYLLSVILRGIGSIDDVAGYQLARDLFPWACAFTVMAACLAFFGLRTASILNSRPTALSGLGFSRS